MQASNQGALSGIRIIEYADFVSGPYLARQLAEMGADVIKIEPPNIGDTARRAGPFAHDVPSLDNSLLFNFHNVNKRGITLDLGCATGQELFHTLLANADIFVYGGSAVRMDELGLVYDVLKKVNPHLIATYVTPFGLTGPYRNYLSNEVINTHLSGFAFSTPGGVTDPNKPPLKAGGRQSLMIAGLHGAAATMEALFARDATGQGQEVDVSEHESITSFLFGSIIRYTFTGLPGARGDVQERPVYKAANGTIAINPSQEHMWQALLHLMGDPAWSEEAPYATRDARNANRKALQDKVNEWTSTINKEELYQLLQGARVPAFPTNTVADVLKSEQLKVRGFWEDLPLPSGEMATAPGPRYKLDHGAIEIARPAPKLGEHTVQVLREELGLSSDDVVALFEVGVI